MSSTIPSRPLSRDAVIVPSQSGNWLNVVKQQVEALKFGSVSITIHEGRVVQIETSLKVRFDKTS